METPAVFANADTANCTGRPSASNLRAGRPASSQEEQLCTPVLGKLRKERSVLERALTEVSEPLLSRIIQDKRRQPSMSSDSSRIRLPATAWNKTSSSTAGAQRPPLLQLPGDRSTDGSSEANIPAFRWQETPTGPLLQDRRRSSTVASTLCGGDSYTWARPPSACSGQQGILEPAGLGHVQHQQQPGKLPLRLGRDPLGAVPHRQQASEKSSSSTGFFTQQCPPSLDQVSLSVGAPGASQPKLFQRIAQAHSPEVKVSLLGQPSFSVQTIGSRFHVNYPPLCLLGNTPAAQRSAAALQPSQTLRHACWQGSRRAVVPQSARSFSRLVIPPHSDGVQGPRWLPYEEIPSYKGTFAASAMSTPDVPALRPLLPGETSKTEEPTLPVHSMSCNRLAENTDYQRQQVPFNLSQLHWPSGTVMFGLVPSRKHVASDGPQQSRNVRCQQSPHAARFLQTQHFHAESFSLGTPSPGDRHEFLPFWRSSALSPSKVQENEEQRCLSSHAQPHLLQQQRPLRFSEQLVLAQQPHRDVLRRSPQGGLIQTNLFKREKPQGWLMPHLEQCNFFPSANSREKWYGTGACEIQQTGGQKLHGHVLSQEEYVGPWKPQQAWQQKYPRFGGENSPLSAKLLLVQQEELRPFEQDTIEQQACDSLPSQFVEIVPQLLHPTEQASREAPYNVDAFPQQTIWIRQSSENDRLITSLLGVPTSCSKRENRYPDARATPYHETPLMSHQSLGPAAAEHPITGNTPSLPSGLDCITSMRSVLPLKHDSQVGLDCHAEDGRSRLAGLYGSGQIFLNTPYDFKNPPTRVLQSFAGSTTDLTSSIRRAPHSRKSRAFPRGDVEILGSPRLNKFPNFQQTARRSLLQPGSSLPRYKRRHSPPVQPAAQWHCREDEFCKPLNQSEAHFYALPNVAELILADQQLAQTYPSHLRMPVAHTDSSGKADAGDDLSPMKSASGFQLVTPGYADEQGRQPEAPDSGAALHVLPSLVGRPWEQNDGQLLCQEAPASSITQTVCTAHTKGGNDPTWSLFVVNLLIEHQMLTPAALAPDNTLREWLIPNGFSFFPMLQNRFCRLLQ